MIGLGGTEPLCWRERLLSASQAAARQQQQQLGACWGGCGAAEQHGMAVLGRMQTSSSRRAVKVYAATGGCWGVQERSKWGRSEHE